MVRQSLEDFQKLSFKQKNEMISRLALFPAITVMVWMRRGIGSRLLNAHAGVMCLILFLACPFIPNRYDRRFLFGFTLITLLLSMRQRFMRWREFRRGVRQHSYYLGTSTNENRGLKFFHRKRRIERFVEPFFYLAAGFALALLGLQVTGYWIMFAAFCLAGAESWVRAHHFEQQMDLVDGMIHSEIQTETVEEFSEPAPPAIRPALSGAIPTGVGSDIGHKLKNRPKR